MKICINCSKELSENMFYKHFWNKDGLSGSCKMCDKEKVERRRRTFDGFLTHVYSNQVRKSRYRGYKPPLYTKKEFVDWAMNNENYIYLYKSWVESGYKKDKAPSFDRYSSNDNEYNYKPYSLDRLRVITWGEHNKLPINKKYIKNIKLTAIKDSSKIKFNSIQEASEYFNIKKSDIKCYMHSNKKILGYKIMRDN